MNHLECIIYHHLGLGDHIICNGLVRYLINKFNLKKLALAVKESNVDNVIRMFADKPEIQFLIVNNDEDFERFHQRNPSIPVLKAGFEKCRNGDFDKSFYDSLSVPFNERWDSWYIERDHTQENEVFKALNIEGEYIFVHDDSSVGKYDLKIDSDLRQIRPHKLKCERSIFDWIKVIENAKEVHVISSSFVHLINSLKLDNKLYFHNIKYSHGMFFCLNNQWNIVDCYK